MLTNSIPLVAVRMLTYNHENYISQCIESIVSQEATFKYILIIGEDCSTDATSRICGEYANKYPETIKLICNEKNDIVINSINNFHACYTSGAKYIALIEGDDYWCDKNKLQQQIDFLETHSDYAICFHRVYQLEDNKQLRLSNLNISEEEETYTIEDLAKDNFIHTPSVVFRSHIIKELPTWFYHAPVGDYTLHMLNARHGKIKYFPEPMAVYRKHEGGIWSSLSRVKILQNWIKVLDLLLTEDFEELVKHNLILQKRKYAEELLLLLMNEENWKMFLEQLAVLSKEDKEISQKWLNEYYPQYINRLNNKIEQLVNSRSFKLASSIQRVAKKVKR